jgi:hypothetical protein
VRVGAWLNPRLTDPGQIQAVRPQLLKPNSAEAARPLHLALN